MGAMANTTEEILSLILASQGTAASHQKNCLLLRKVYQKVAFGDFWEIFLHPINVILDVDLKQSNPYVDRIMQFVGLFCATLKRTKNNDEKSVIEEPLITKLLGYLLQGSQCVSDTVRFRCCQMINTIMDCLVGSEIGDELYEHMYEVLMDRLSDTKGVIRLQAVNALYRLQDPTDPEDPLISEFIQLMHDSTAKVRKLCVEKIAYRRDVLDYIVNRTRDVDVNVRLAAFKRLSKLGKSLKITGRRKVLFAGIFDSSNKVKSYLFSEFLTSWWEIYNNDIMELMKSIRLDADDRDIEATTDLYEHILNEFYFKTRNLKELFDVLPLSDQRLVPNEDLNWETITYWRLLIKLLTKNADLESHLENVLPEVLNFCQYIKCYSEDFKTSTIENYLEKQYVIQQLFRILKTCDLADTYNVRTLHELVDYLLKKEDLLPETVESIIATLEHTLPDPEKRSRFGMEIISDILYPVDAAEEARIQQEKDCQLSKLKVQLVTLKMSLENAIETADFVEAEKLKHLTEDVSFQINDLKKSMDAPSQEVPNKQNNSATLCKCLDIAWAILRCANVSRLTPSLKSLKTDFLPELLSHESEFVRLKALKCYSICCIYDKYTAQQGIHIFAVPIAAYQAGEECDTQTLILCISTVSDLVRIYGDDLMAEPHEDELSESVNEEHQRVFAGGTSLTSLVQGLVDLMDDEQVDIQLKATEGLCKLVLDERIHSPALISRLILKWCNPIDKDETDNLCLKQLIGCILEKLPNLPNSSEQLEGAVLLTINTLVNAPKNSPLAVVDIDNIAKFMLALCKLSPKGPKLNCNIAMSLCSKINQAPDSKVNSIYSRILLMLDIPEDQSFIEELFVLVDEAREYIGEKVMLRNITKYLGMLSEALSGNKGASVITEAQEDSGGDDLTSVEDQNME